MHLKNSYQNNCFEYSPKERIEFQINILIRTTLKLYLLMNEFLNIENGEQREKQTAKLH